MSRNSGNLRVKMSQQDRKVRTVEPPPWFPLTDAQLFTDSNTDKINIDVLRQFLKKGGKLSLDHVSKIIKKSTSIMMQEQNCLELYGSFIVIGDIHGQYYDLNGIIEKDLKVSEAGIPTNTWVFLGDYVDRGSFGVEVVILLYALKINFPNHVFLLRGNHETRLLTKKFNFYEESKTKYSEDIYKLFMNSFDALPLAATLSTNMGIFFAVHGGISPKLDTISSINSIDRFCEPEKDGAICDLIWSDPLEEETAETLPAEKMPEWWDVQYVENPNRGVGQVFGWKALNYFLMDNGLLGIIRGHETAQHGYIENWMKKKNEGREFPFVVTVFSAPNYCGCYGNLASVLYLLPNSYNLRQFSAEDEPYVLPRNMNAIAYSMPWISAQTSSLISVFFGMLIDVLPDEEAKMKKTLINKVKLVGRTASLMRRITETNEKLRILRGLYGQGDLPEEITSLPIQELDKLIHQYSNAKKIDEVNEFYPTTEKTDKKGKHIPEHNKNFWVGKSRSRESFLEQVRSASSPISISPSIVDTYKKIRNHREDTNWMIFIYEQDLVLCEKNLANTSITSPTPTRADSLNTVKNLVLWKSGKEKIPPLKRLLLSNVRAYCFFRLDIQENSISSSATSTTSPSYQNNHSKFVFFTWCPESVGPKKRGEIASHKGFVQKFLGEFSVEIRATEKDEIEHLISKLKNKT